MYVAIIPNRNSNPTWLVRESVREGKKVRKITLCNITKLPLQARIGIQKLFKGGIVVENPVEYFKNLFTLAAQRPHGHVAATLGMLRKLKLHQIIDKKDSRARNIILALIVGRILEPGSKLSTAQALRTDSASSSLGQELDLSNVHENEIYQAMDWLYERKDAIEKKLASRHLKEGSVVLCDVSSTYVEGYGADLAAFGYSRDGKKGKKQINFGLLCDKDGRPVAAEVFPGSTADPRTLTAQLDKLRQRFGLVRVTIVGDRGLLTHARLREEVQPAGYDWITALRKESIRKLVRKGAIQPSLFDEVNLAEVTSAEYPGERLVVCRNPLTAARAARKRTALLEATEKKLEAVVAATRRPQRPLRGIEKIAKRVGGILTKSKMSKYFKTTTTDTSFSYARDQAAIEEATSLDGVYVIRTSVAPEEISADEAVRTYKQLAVVEKAFRSLKTVDLKVRPIYHYRANRIRSHIFLCMLAYYVEWHMKEKLSPMLFADEDPAATRAARDDVVKPAKPSEATKKKARTKTTADGQPALSFKSLMAHLRTLNKNELTGTFKDQPVAFTMLSKPSDLQRKAFALLGVPLK